MNGRVRLIAFGVVLVVAALGLFLFSQHRLGTAPAQQATVDDCTINPRWAKYRGLTPDWQQLVRQANGLRVEFNPFTIVCDPAKRQRDVAVQLIYDKSMRETFKDGDITSSIAYNRERYRYRFDCVARTFAILDRSLMGSGEQVAYQVRMADPANVVMRPIADGGVAAVVAPPTCSTGRI
jgi:hypothetical protein